MRRDSVLKVAADVHKLAGETHCASAILATSSYLAKYERGVKGFEEKLADIEKRMHQALDKNDQQAIKSLRDEYKKIKSDKERVFFMIRLTHAELDENDARRIDFSDNHFTIVLPECHLKTIKTGLEEGNWTEEMLAAKNKLRELTMHELGHPIIACKKNDSSPVSENDVHMFVDDFLRLYNRNRIDSIVPLPTT